MYRAADGWMFVVIPARDIRGHLIAILGDDRSEASDDALTAAVQSAFNARTCEEWRAELAPRGIVIQPLETLCGLRETHTWTGSAPWSASSFLFTRVARHPVGRAVTLVAPIAVRPAHTTIVVPHDAPKYGQHTERILSELGYCHTEINGLLLSGAAGLSWSAAFLPD